MRTATTGQLADLATADRRVDFRVWVANSSGTLVEYTSDVLSWTIDASVEQNAATATIRLQRENSSGSNAPMIATGAATDPIDVNRAVRIEAQVVSAGASLGSWVRLFDGVVDEPSWGGDDSVLTLTCRDGWYEIQDAWIESETTYGSTGGTAINTVMQSLIDDTLGTGAPQILTSGSPSTVIYEYTQRRMALGDALREVINVNGWDLRFLWSTGDSAFRLKFFQPPRSKTTPDHTFTLGDYFTVSDIRRSSSGIRNVVLIEYATGSTVETSSTGSIAEHGRRFMYIDSSNDPQITTSGIAASLGGDIVSDLAQPLAQKIVQARFFWPTELGDLYRFPRNDVHYASTQDMAVVSYRHEYQAGQPPATTFVLRGQPTGGQLRWLSRARSTKMNQEIVRGPTAITVPDPIEIISVGAVTTSGGKLTAAANGSTNIASFKIAGAFGSVPLATTVRGTTAINGNPLTTGTVGVLATGGNPGQMGYVAAFGYTATGGGGTETDMVISTAMFGTEVDGLPSGSVGSAQLTTGAVVASKMSKQAQGYATNLVFSSNAYNRVLWGTGTIEFADGTTTAISSGSQLLTLSSPTTYFVYYNGTSTLQVTTTYSTAVGDDNVILCVAQQAPDTSHDQCFYVPGVGALRGGVRVTADQIAANSITASKINVTSLSAISANIGTVTAGTIDANVIVAADSFTAPVAAFNSASFDDIDIKSGAASMGTIEPNVTTATGIRLDPAAGLPTEFGGAISRSFRALGNVVVDGSLTASGSVFLTNATGDTVSFHGAAGSTKQTITGSRGGNAALANLLTALANLGLITDSTT